MTQFVNNFLINFNITNILYILASFIEIYLFLKLLLIILKISEIIPTIKPLMQNIKNKYI